MPSAPIDRLVIDAADADAWKKTATDLAFALPAEPTPEILSQLAVAAHDLPLSIRQSLMDFRLSVPGAPRGGMVVSGLPVADSQLGPTPPEFQAGPRSYEARAADMGLLLLASLLGDPFSHAAVQGGSLILDICPLAGHEKTQLASSSSGELAWHNEDAYHEFRADWLLLMCMRNPERTATTFARVDDIDLPPDVRKALYEPVFDMLPDESHLSPNQVGGVRQIAVLSGPPEAPFLCIDPEFMRKQSVEENAGHLDKIIGELECRLQEVVLRPGEVLIVDNRRAVHGRAPFDARYDGTDRWLRVVNVTADLRKSAGERTTGGVGPARHDRALRTQGVVGG